MNDKVFLLSKNFLLVFGKAWVDFEIFLKYVIQRLFINNNIFVYYAIVYYAKYLNALTK